MSKQDYLDYLQEQLDNGEITGFEYDELVEQAEYREFIND